MKEDVSTRIFGVKTIYEVMTSLKKQLFPLIVKKERNLKNMLMTQEKKIFMVSWKIFKKLKKYMWQSCYNKKSIFKLKVLQFTHGLRPRNGNFLFFIYAY